MTLDRALSGNPFGIDQFRCQEAANALRAYRPMVHAEPWSRLPRVSQFVFKTLFISICHQINWDFLQSTMARWLLPHPEKRLDEIAQVRSSDIARLLSTYPRPERVRKEQRARMLRETAVSLTELLRGGRIRTLLAHRRLEGPGGFYKVIRTISAFAEDELEKKMRVLAHDLHREGIIRFVDAENLRPAVEYHILRLYIRSGRVYPTDDAVRAELLNPQNMARGRLVKLLRKTVEEAMDFTAFYADLDVATLNYLEWQIGRAVCTPTDPSCGRTPSTTLPTDVAELSPHHCAFASFCRSYTEPQYGWYHEPHFHKAIY